MAKKICVSSDVEMSHLILDFDFLLEVIGSDLSDLIGDKPIIQLNYRDLYLKIDVIKTTIDGLLLNRKEPDWVTYKKLESGRTVEIRKSITEIEYEGKILKLDLRESDDFRICVYINLLSIIKTCVLLNGALYFFNRELLEQYDGADIVGYLRINQAKKKDEIECGLNELWKRLKINCSIESNILTKGLDNLKKYGLVDHDRRGDEYRLTARGFMFW